MDTYYPCPGLDCRFAVNAYRPGDTHNFARSKESTTVPGLPQHLEIPIPTGGRTNKLKAIKISLRGLSFGIFVIIPGVYLHEFQ